MKAGFSEVDISPPEGVFLTGWTGQMRKSEGCLEPLYMRALAMEDDGGERVVLVTAELGYWCARSPS